MASTPTTGITSWRDAVKLVKTQIPDLFTKGKLSFITIHYIYMIGMSLLFSVIIYGIGGIDYIDALFFASGGCTQSGLNTVDVNLTKTGQQICFYITAMLCNPIVVHGSVVFVRLYWFEKRFEDVVREARALRRTKSMRRGSLSKDDTDLEEARVRGVRGAVLHFFRDTGRRLTNKHITENTEVENEKRQASIGSSDDSPQESDIANRTPPRKPSALDSMTDLRLPAPLNTEQHITFLENQRNPKDTTTLRIPSPREFDRGGRVENIDERIEQPVSSRAITRRLNTQEEEVGGEEEEEAPAPPIRAHLTFNEPDMSRIRSRNPEGGPKLNNKRTPTVNSRLSANSGKQQLGQRTWTMGSFRRTNTNLESMPYLSYEPTVGRNSFFINLTEEQREELGGIEYRALKTLALILICYFIGFHLFAILCLLPWIMRDGYYGLVPMNDGVGRPWWGIFTAASAFNDLGYTLTPDSMISFQTATWPLLVMTFLIIIGNTGFPCMLRFTIWLISLFTPVGSGLWEELRFLLDHPRRCFTLLFPRAATWWLFFILVLLNGLDLFFFVILDLKDSTVTSLSGWFKFLDGLFQAASTRTAGFAVVNLADLHPAIQVSYLIMMYISVLPIAISMRRTNVYEERSLGIYATQDKDDGDDEKEPSYVGAHLRKQLSFDLWYIFLGLFIIAIVEGGRLEANDDYAFNLFSVLFEIVSAYGTVGLSLGYPTINASFSAEFKTLSKLVIIAMQIRGRHRGLPYELDRAVLLPSESLHAKEHAEARRMMSRRPSIAQSVASSAVDGQIGSGRFRPETGLTSGNDLDRTQSSRDRRLTNKSHATFASSDSHHSTAHGPRRELGNLMHKVAVAGDVITEEAKGSRSSS